MKITFLGTGSSLGVPVIGCNCAVCQSSDSRDKRLRSSVYVEHKNTALLIDASPDFRYQALKYIRKVDLDAILLTHAHRDHIAGLDDLRPFIFFDKKNKAVLDVFGDSLTIEGMKRLFFYSFGEDRYPGAPVFNINILKSGDTFIIKDLKITAFRVWHGKMPILGYKINDFVYITDASYVEENIIKLIGTPQILTVNAIREKKHYSHFNLTDALDFIKKVKPDKAFITHIGHKLGKYVDVQKKLPENVSLAYDGLSVEL